MKYLLLLFSLFLPSCLVAEELVGVGVPLSGDAAWLGNNVQEGIKLYLSEKPSDSAAVIKVEDIPLAQVAAGVSAIRKFVEVDQVKGLILCSSPVVGAVAPLVDEKKVPTIAIVGADTARGRKYQVRLWPNADAEMKALSDLLAKKRVALLYSEQDSMLARKKSFEQAAAPNLDLVFSSAIDTETAAPVISRMLQAKAQAVVLLLLPGKNGLIAKKLRELGFHGELAGSPAINSEEEVKLAAGALGNASFPDSKTTEEFLSAFQKKYGHPPGIGAAAGYDAAKILFEAIHSAPNDAEKVNELIHRRSVAGAMGEYGLDEASNSFDVPVVLRQVREE